MASFDFANLMNAQASAPAQQGGQFDINNFLSNPIAALGIGLLTSNTPQEGIKQGMGLLSAQSERKRQEQQDKLNQLLLTMKIKEAGQPQTGFGKLLMERDSLPEGDPRRDLYDAQIKKENTASSLFGSIMPAISPTGEPSFINSRTGQPVDTGYKPTPNKIGDKSTQPLPTTALKLQQEALDAIGTAKSIEADLGSVSQTLNRGDLNLGPWENMKSKAKNYTGISDENSRNFATFQSTLEKLRNDSLRLNKGVQTEGDAQRAWNELFAGINDQELVKQRLLEIQKINERAATLHQNNIDILRSNYGKDPLDTSGYDQGSAILGGNQPPNAYDVFVGAEGNIPAELPPPGQPKRLKFNRATGRLE